MNAGGRIGIRSTLCAALAVTFAVSSCASTTPDASPNASPDASDDQSITVFAAASLEPAFTELIDLFGTNNPDVTFESVVFDGSATLVTQLEQGAQADVFAAADEASMAEFANLGIGQGEPQIFATNTLVIATASGNPLGITGIDDLAGAKVAVCASEVPCGRATEKLLGASGSEIEATSEEQSVTAVAERVVSGEFDAGIVYATDVAARNEQLEAVVPDGAAEVVNRYPITTIEGSPGAADSFVQFVQSDVGLAVLERHGFGRP